MIRSAMLHLTLFFVAVIFLFAGSVPESSAQSERDRFLPKAVEILERVPLFDGHNDAPWQYRIRVGYKLSELDFMDTSHIEENPVHTDIRRLREGRVGAQWWSVYVPASMTEAEAVAATLEQIDFVHRIMEAYPDHFELALTADDVERIFAEGKIASMIGLEGGHSISNSMAVLRMMHSLGARYMTLTHNRALDWVDAEGDAPRHGGLSPFGEEVIREMNRLGILPDLSHATVESMKHVIEVSEAPPFFSHSNARTLSGHPRNVPDEVLDLVQENNGLVMVTFVETFVSEERRLYFAERSAFRQKMDYLYRGELDSIAVKMEEWDTEFGPAPKSTLEQVADHIDYLKERIGVAHIGIGGDYDGVGSLPEGLEDVSTYPALFAELLLRGYTEKELEKIAGLNMLRVLRAAEEVAERLGAERGPSEMRISDQE